MGRDNPNYKLWSQLPYAGETKPPSNPEEPLAGSWPLFFLKREKHHGETVFTDDKGNPLQLIKDPNQINFEQELKIVQETLANLTPQQKAIARYWGTGVATKQWTPIIDRLIDTYNTANLINLLVSAPRAARILASVQAGINDTFVVTWYLKYKYNVARPNQLDQNLATLLCTPRHPSYPSGHAAVAGCASTILSYFFPGEKNRLTALAEEVAQSRLFAGVHFPSDNHEGLRLGREIGGAVINVLKKQKDAEGNPVDQPIQQNLNAALPPPPYQQVIPFNFPDFCQSKVMDDD
ncbi:vanadium-dependent haloperoxidase [Marininema halotolerans]|uniref:PAP2 superfamily protein n=1 Tax=Marininema halotolerans TaxID=1155944 RepID=A0A1I6PR93_9BACL|nr:vanadium-dependent haloperoxidase [Marininema halotolerans]SFS42752.1 PAP2 superfamily protein [Marininema halotolerans]